MFGHHFFFAIVVGGVDCDLAGQRVDHDFHRMLEGGAFLNEMVVQ